ncbi:hypothetical protein V8F06_007489 [Rhypophila decipiens]
MATTGRFPVFAIVRLVLHVIAVVAAVLILPYIVWLSLHGVQSVDVWIVLCIAACWSVLLNSYEAMRQGAIAAGTGIDKPHSRLAGLRIYIGAHIATLLFLLTGLVFSVRRSTRGVLFGGPTPPEEEKLRLQEEGNKLSTMAAIANSLACVLQVLFYNFARVDYRRMGSEKKAEKASLSAEERSQPADTQLAA